MNAEQSSDKPRFFEIVGWSWLAMGLIGLLLGLLSVPTLFRVDEMRKALFDSPVLFNPDLFHPLDRMISLIVPATLGQIGVSLVLVAAAWQFLAGRNWARWVLSILNVVSMIGTVAGLVALLNGLGRVFQALRLADLAKMDLIANVPLWVNSVLIALTVLFLIPLLWMEWYFHSPTVRAYFKRDG